MFKYSIIYIITLSVEFLAFIGYRWFTLEQGILIYDFGFFMLFFNNLLVILTLITYMNKKNPEGMGLNPLSTGDRRNYQVETLGYQKEDFKAHDDFFGNEITEAVKKEKNYLTVFAYISVLLTNLLGFIVYLVV